MAGLRRRSQPVDPTEFQLRLTIAGWLMLLVSAWLCALTEAWNALLVTGAGLLTATILVVSRWAESRRVSSLRIGSLERVAADVARRSDLDGLTGLPNREAFERRLAEEIERAVRHQQPVAICFVDIDHFKVINDTLGHKAGDRVLAMVAASLKATARTIDVVARYGGEEFVVIAPGTWSSDAVALADRLRRSVSALPTPGVGRLLTISVGVAGLPEHASRADALLERADEALYAAKRAGRDRTMVATSSGIRGRA